MLKKFVEAILLKNTSGIFRKTRKVVKKVYTSRSNFKRRRNKEDSVGKNIENETKHSQYMDNIKTHEVKKQANNFINNVKIPSLLFLIIFYVCLFNVIISCDVNINTVNIKADKDDKSLTFNREKPWINLGQSKLKVHGKNLRKGRASLHEESEDTSEKYTNSGAQDLDKYYNYYKNKEEFTNSTDYPKNLLVLNNIYDNTRAIGYPHDLASSPYFVKRTNFNLRPERHQFDEKIVKLGVLLSADPTQVFSLAKVLPIVEMAAVAVTTEDGPLPGWKILVDYRDTRCSSVDGPLAAFEFYVNGSAGKYY